MSEQLYAPEYLRSQKDKQLHFIADMIERQIEGESKLEAELAMAKQLDRTKSERIKELEEDCKYWDALHSKYQKENAELKILMALAAKIMEKSIGLNLVCHRHKRDFLNKPAVKKILELSETNVSECDSKREREEGKK